jgi:dihydroorotate dehydrogenase electron transfer subunit
MSGPSYSHGAPGYPRGSDALPRPVRIAQVRQENERVTTLVLDARAECTPGQFAMLWLPRVDEKPFSISDDDPLTFVVSQAGPFSTALSMLKPGDWLWWRGPFGHGFVMPERDEQCLLTGKELLLVSGGYGAAPLALLAKRAAAFGWPITLVAGAKTTGDLILVDRFKALECSVLPCTEDGSCGERGLVTKGVEIFLQDAGADAVPAVFGCGPEAMLEAVRHLCHKYHLPCQLSYEGYMKCAVGVCGSCARHGLLVCRDGPVLQWSAEGKRLPTPDLPSPQRESGQSGGAFLHKVHDRR